MDDFIRSVRPEKELSLPPPPVIFEEDPNDMSGFTEHVFETRKYWEGLYMGLLENGKREGKGRMVYLTGTKKAKDVVRSLESKLTSDIL
jgi:hypothetical protein